jgi:hypothetical protein
MKQQLLQELVGYTQVDNKSIATRDMRSMFEFIITDQTNHTITDTLMHIPEIL